MEINFGESPLIENPNQVYHNSTLKGKGTKESPLKVSVDALDIVVDSDTLTGEGTLENPITIIPEGAILTEDGSPLLTEAGEFIIQEGYVQPSDILRYVALLTQSGTDAPIPIVLENTIGPITWSYEGVGYYGANSDNLFTDGKTWATGSGVGETFLLGAQAENTGLVTFFYGSEIGPSAPFYPSIEIRVYP